MWINAVSGKYTANAANPNAARVGKIVCVGWNWSPSSERINTIPINLCFFFFLNRAAANRTKFGNFNFHLFAFTFRSANFYYFRNYFAGAFN